MPFLKLLLGDYPILIGYKIFTLFFLLSGSVAHFTSWHKATHLFSSTYSYLEVMLGVQGVHTQAAIAKLICTASFKLHSAELKHAKRTGKE